MTNEVTQENSTPATEQSLDQIAASLEARAPVVQETIARPEIKIPDAALDPEGFATALNAKFADQSELTEFVRSQKAAASASEQTAAIDSAVSAISANIEGADKRLVRGLLKDEYDVNPAFKKIWDSRSDNPAALGKAIAVLTQSFRETLAIKVDSQVAADQRAFSASMNSARHAKASSANDKWKGLDGAAFDAEWAKISGQN